MSAEPPRRAAPAPEPRARDALGQYEKAPRGVEEGERRPGAAGGHDPAPALVRDRRRLVGVVAVLLAVVAAVYVLVPQIAGLDDALSRIDRVAPGWLAAAVLFCGASFAAYVALFRGVLGGTGGALRRRLGVGASYDITMAGLAATRLFSAAGAGGIVLTYWALRKAGLERRRAASRLTAFLVLLYAVYLVTVVAVGLLLWTGAVPGPAPLGGTIVPAGVAGAVLLVLGVVALAPGSTTRRLERAAGPGVRRGRLADRLADASALLATGVRTAVDYLAHPRRGAPAVAGAIGFWAANIAVLWASFRAFGADLPAAVLVQGFFVGTAANLLPSPAGGAGSVDAGLIGAFLLFGEPYQAVLPAVLTYRVVAFWLPILPGAAAYVSLRKRVREWEREDARGYTIESKVRAEART